MNDCLMKIQIFQAIHRSTSCCSGKCYITCTRVGESVFGLKLNDSFWFKDQDGVEVFVRKWVPDVKPKAVIQIAHGGAEHVGRYTHVAEAFAKAGYAVYADDHRGHGLTGIRYAKLGDLGPGGIDSTVRDLKELTDIIKKEHPDLPVFLLGHSWGSRLARNYIQEWGKELQGTLLTGAGGLPTLVITHKPGDYGWLSRDESVIKRYLEDPLCGEPVHFDRDAMAILNQRIFNPENAKRIPKRMPIYIFVGSEDHNGGEKGAKALAEMYTNAGIQDVTYKVYSGGHHELFNEFNKEEVINDVIAWLNNHL